MNCKMEAESKLLPCVVLCLMTLAVVTQAKGMPYRQNTGRLLYPFYLFIHSFTHLFIPYMYSLISIVYKYIYICTGMYKTSTCICKVYQLQFLLAIYYYISMI